MKSSVSKPNKLKNPKPEMKTSNSQGVPLCALEATTMDSGRYTSPATRAAAFATMRVTRYGASANRHLGGA